MIDRFYKIYYFWRAYGFAPTCKIIFRKLKLLPPTSPLTSQTDQLPILKSSGTSNNVAQIIDKRFQALAPLHTYYLPDSQTGRVNIVTDSISSGSLFGGVGTALIFAALLANKLNASLRIITRTEPAKSENVEHVLSLYGIHLKQEIQFKFAAFYDHKYELDIFKNDLFITTSWWTTAATLPSVSSSKIIYLLQEDERMFYPFGDDRLKCETILQNSDIRFVINTKLLYDYLVNDGLENIANHGFWFEPAFPKQVFHPVVKEPNTKQKFFFYARPNNLRNLFFMGIEVIEKAITQNILDLDHWDIFLVGKDIPAVTFKSGYQPIRCENFSWSEYAKLVGTVDLGLSLMYTPHPSYPPLDLVASGAVVVTNRFANKLDLSDYSANLICADLNSDALVDALKLAVNLTQNNDLREQNFRLNGLNTNWQDAFSRIIDQLIESV